MMEGILLVDKPEGWTSFDVVNYVRKLVANQLGIKTRSLKVGHTGTLDPAATGLLVICVGRKYTKKVPELIKKDKTYEVEITLGKVSNTNDKEGEISRASDYKPTIDEVNAALSQFVGTIQQKPPAFSAIKVNGKRAYQLARSGVSVELAARTVQINSITNVRYTYPIVAFKVEVGSGTYIRSLAVDIGDKLLTGAYMNNLRRLKVGSATIDKALTVNELTPLSIKNNLEKTE
jgi:tRNA pseudouridine55 synthase